MPDVNSSSIAACAAFADGCESEPEYRGPRIVDRLDEGIPGECQLMLGGQGYSDALGECGRQDAQPAEVLPHNARRDGFGCTRLRLCPPCFAKSARLRPTRWLF